MAQSPDAPAPSQQMDPGLAAILTQALGDGTSPTSPGTGFTIEDLLKQTLFGVSGRAGLTSQPLVGVMPAWVRTDPRLLAAARQREIDPYLPTQDIATWQVFVGRDVKHTTISGQMANFRDAEGLPAAAKGHSGDQTESVQAVSNQPFLWSEDQIKDGIKRFQDAGFSNVTDLDSLQKAWSGLAAQAGARYSLSSGKIKVTPWDMLELNKSTMSGGAGGSGGSPSTVTQKTRSVANITHGDGWNALQSTLSHMLGRDPTDEETRDFVGRMNYLAAKNPTITTSTTSGIGTGNQNTKTKTKGGFDSNDILENAYAEAQSNPDYAETQAGTTYFNAVLSALGAIGG